MENKMSVFTNEEFGEIRTMEVNSKIYFCGKDVATVLGYKDTVNALKTHCKQDGVVFYHLTDSLGRNQEVKFITEGNVYRLITRSKLPTAEEFERWLFDEVVPSIRKHGGYIAGQEQMSNEDLLCKALLFAQSKIEEKDKLLAEVNAKLAAAEPKIQFHDAVTASEDSISVGDMAKLLNQNGVPIGQNKLFEWLRRSGYLMTRKSEYNLPTQKSMEMNLFEIHEHTFCYGSGVMKTGQTTRVTGTGQQYFINLFLHKKDKDGESV